MSVILGLNINHPDTSAAILVDGQLKFAIAEERLTRVKNTSKFPINAIKCCLDFVGINLEDIDDIAIAGKFNSNLLPKINYFFQNPYSSLSRYISNFSRIKNSEINLINFVDYIECNRRKIKFKINHVEHHLAHVASSFFLSPYDKSSALSYDGSGDFCSALLAKCEGNNIKIFSKSFAPNSLGYFYTTMCQLIGFNFFGEEFKVMGLAPYGEDIYSSEMSKLIFKKKNLYKLNTEFINPSNFFKNGTFKNNIFIPGAMYNKKTLNLFKIDNPRERNQEITNFHQNIAKSTQVQFEKIAIHILKYLSNEKFSSNLSLSGGCALNGVLNTKILSNNIFKKMYVQPASSDDGLSLGAAYFNWNIINKKKSRFNMYHAYFGNSYTRSSIKNLIQQYKFEYFEFNNFHECIVKTSNLLIKNFVVGWFQGRSEWGPRALGNRSILANPLNVNMKKIINHKIKKRESFRPFAPVVLDNDLGNYFIDTIHSPFMNHVVKFKDDFKNLFPSITHIDSTGRVQSVNRDQNPKLYDLLVQFKKVSGHGVLLNTSFNENEPIVESPHDAIKCFERTDIDVLVLENFIIFKNKNLLK